MLSAVIKEYNHNTTSWQPTESSPIYQRDILPIGADCLGLFVVCYKLEGSYLQIFANLLENDCSQSKWNCSCLVTVVSRSLRLWDSEKSALGLKVWEEKKKNQYNHPETTVLFSLCCDWLTLSKCRMSENSPAHLKWQIIKLYLPTCFAYIHRFIFYYLQTVCLTLKCYDEMHAEGAKRHARRQEVVNTKSKLI